MNAKNVPLNKSKTEEQKEEEETRRIMSIANDIEISTVNDILNSNSMLCCSHFQRLECS